MNNFIFVAKLISLLLQILFSLAMLAVAMASLILISAVERPSFVSVAPRYLKAITSSSCWPFMLICTVDLSPLLTMTLLFSLLISMPYSRALFDNLSVSSCNSSLLPPIRSMSSANLGLEIIRPPMEIVDLKLCNVSLMMFSKYKLKRIGERRQPCRTPTVVLK